MILLDQCVPRKYLKLLEDWGYDVSLLTDHAPADSKDTNVIQLAQELDAVFLTVDLDFSNITDYPPSQYQGIVVIRYILKDEDSLSRTLQSALNDLYRDDLRQHLVIVEPFRYRIRRN